MQINVSFVPSNLPSRFADSGALRKSASKACGAFLLQPMIHGRMRWRFKKVGKGNKMGLNLDVRLDCTILKASVVFTVWTCFGRRLSLHVAPADYVSLLYCATSTYSISGSVSYVSSLVQCEIVRQFWYCVHHWSRYYCVC